MNMRHQTHIILALTLLHIALNAYAEANTDSLLRQNHNKPERPFRGRRSLFGKKFASSRTSTAKPQTPPGLNATTGPNEEVVQNLVSAEPSSSVKLNLESKPETRQPEHSSFAQNFMQGAEAFEIVDDSEDWDVYDGNLPHPILSAHEDANPDEELNSIVRAKESTEDPLLEEVDGESNTLSEEVRTQSRSGGIEVINDDKNGHDNRAQEGKSDEVTAVPEGSLTSTSYQEDPPAQADLPGQTPSSGQTPSPEHTPSSEQTSSSDQNLPPESPPLAKQEISTEPTSSLEQALSSEPTSSAEDLTLPAQAPPQVQANLTEPVSDEEGAREEVGSTALPSDDNENTSVDADPEQILSTKLDHSSETETSVEVSSPASVLMTVETVTDMEFVDAKQKQPESSERTADNTPVDVSSLSSDSIEKTTQASEPEKVAPQVHDVYISQEPVETPAIAPTTEKYDATTESSSEETSSPEEVTLTEPTPLQVEINLADQVEFIIKMIIYTALCIVIVGTLKLGKRLFETSPKVENPVSIPKETIDELESKKIAARNLKKKLQLDEKADLQKEADRIKAMNLKLAKKREEYERTAPERQRLKKLKQELGDNVDTKISQRRMFLKNLKMLQALLEKNSELKKKVELSRYEYLVMIRNYVKLDDLLDLMRQVEFNNISSTLKEATLEKKVEIDFLKGQIDTFKRLSQKFVSDYNMYNKSIETEKINESTYDKEYKDLKELHEELDLDYSIGKLTKEVEEKCVETDNHFLSYYRDYLYIIGHYKDIGEFLSSSQVEVEGS